MVLMPCPLRRWPLGRKPDVRKFQEDMMRYLIQRLRQWIAHLSAPIARTSGVETMSLHDWADLPSHHPQCD
jgi:hypothetical protein